MKKFLQEKTLAEHIFNADWCAEYNFNNWNWYYCTLFVRYLAKEKGLKPKAIKAELKKRLEQVADNCDWYYPDIDFVIRDKCFNRGYKDRRKEWVEVTQMQIPKAVVDWCLTIDCPEWYKDNPRLKMTDKKYRLWFLAYCFVAYTQKSYKDHGWEYVDLKKKELIKLTGTNYTLIQYVCNQSPSKFNTMFEFYDVEEVPEEYKKYFNTRTQHFRTERQRELALSGIKIDTETYDYSINWVSYHFWFSWQQGLLSWINIYNLLNFVIPDIDELDCYTIPIEKINEIGFAEIVEDWEQHNKAKHNGKGGFTCKCCGKFIAYKTKKSNHVKYCDVCKRKIKNEQNQKSRKKAS